MYMYIPWKLAVACCVILFFPIDLPDAAPPSPQVFTPVKLEHTEQIELGYMPLRDDFEKVSISTTF